MTYTEKRLEWFEEILRDGLSEDWYDRTPLEKQRAIDELLSTSIAQAIAEDRKRVRLEIEGYYIDVDAIFNAEKSGEWVLSIKHSDLLCILDPLTEKEKGQDE